MKRLILVIVCLVLAGCTETEVTSFKDPAYAGRPKFSSVLVVGGYMGLEERQTVEDAASQVFAAHGARVVRGMTVLPPTRQLTDDEFVRAVIGTSAETMLVIAAVDKGEFSTYVPQTYFPGQTYGSANTFGNTTTFNFYQTPGFSTGGYSIETPNAVYRSVLVDVSTGNQIWQADITSEGDEFSDYSDLARATAEEAVDKLYEDGLF